jgi:hypothetical protein
MNREDIKSKLNSVLLCLMAHPENEPHSEFADRISDIQEILEELSTPELCLECGGTGRSYPTLQNPDGTECTTCELKETVKETHELKTINPYFQLVWDGKKTFELRKNDRNFKQGDYLRLMEYGKGGWTGRECNFEIEYILKDCPEFGLMDGFVIIQLKLIVKGD